MARLHLLLSRALTSRPLLPPPPSPLTHSLRPPPRYSSARPPLPVRAPPPPHGSRLLLLAAAATRYYATSSHGRRKRVPPRPLARRRARRRKGPVELSVQIGIEEELPDDPLVLSIAETLQTDVGKAMKVAFENLKASEYKTRDNAINDVEKYDNVEVSLLLCNDSFIRKLNKEWRDEDQATDVLSMSQHIPGLDIPILQLGDIVISVATAHRQAEERGHTLLDEIRILMVHGLLHLLGFDHELSREAEEQMEKEEERILKILEWKGKGLISSAHDVASSKYHSENFDESSENIEKMSVREAHEPKLSHIIYDIDGNLVDYEGHLHPKSIEALREALSRGVKVITSTRNSRAATIRIFKLLDFEGKENVVSTSSPGVFLQGSLVYGRQGQEIYRANLDMDICKEAFMHSLKHMVPLVACCEDKWLTLFEHPSVDLLHTMCHEAKAIVMPSIEDILAYSSIQKLLFLDNAEGASSILRQHLSELTEGQARLIQMQSNMVEIVPFAASKSGGIRILLDHLGIAEDFDLEEVEDCTRWLSDHKDS